MKRVTAIIMAMILCLGLGAQTLADVETDERVTIGANLDAEQKAQIYADFGIEQGSVMEIIITNADERRYMDGIVPEGKIGSVALSCIYIQTLEEGSGLNITTKNINYCTPEMYANALTTAGITDAKVLVSAPFPVSGTAAMTGAYKAYEDITGFELSDLAKTVGVEELIITGDLAEYIGSEDATMLVNELKKILDQTQNMTDDEVRAEIRYIADTYNIILTDGQIEQLLKLCRSLEKLDVDELKKKILSLGESMQGLKKAEEKLSGFVQSVKNFFVAIGDFFVRLFGGGK